jgi:hypothetical protein
MSAAWSVDHGDHSPDKQTTTQALRAAAVGFSNIVGCCYNSRYDFVHALRGLALPDMDGDAWMHSCIDRYINAQCMEHANREVKQGYRKGCSQCDLG